MDTGHEDGRQPGKTCVAPGGGATFYTFSQKKSKRCSHNLCPDYAHYVKPKINGFCGRNKNIAAEGGTVTHCYILVIRKCRFSDILCGLLFLLNNSPLQSLECATNG